MRRMLAIFNFMAFLAILSRVAKLHQLTKVAIVRTTLILLVILSNSLERRKKMKGIWMLQLGQFCAPHRSSRKILESAL